MATPLTKIILRIMRLAVIPVVWLAFIPVTIAAGYDPGPQNPQPYPTGHVVAMCVLLAIESAVLFGILQPATYDLRNWRRALKVLVLVLVGFFFEPPLMTDQPGYTYINASFLFTWSVILGILVVVGLVVASISPADPVDSSHAA